MFKKENSTSSSEKKSWRDNFPRLSELFSPKQPVEIHDEAVELETEPALEVDEKEQYEQSAKTFISIIEENLSHFLDTEMRVKVEEINKFYQQLLEADEVVIARLELALKAEDNVVIEEVIAPIIFSERSKISKINSLIKDRNSFINYKDQIDKLISEGFTFSVNTVTGKIEELNGVAHSFSDFAKMVEQLVEATGFKDEEELGIILAAVVEADSVSEEKLEGKIASEKDILAVVEETLQTSQASLQQEAEELAVDIRSKNERISLLQLEDKVKLARQSLSLQFFINFFKDISSLNGKYYYGIDVSFLDKNSILQRVNSHVAGSGSGLSWVGAMVNSTSPRDNIVYGPNGSMVARISSSLSNLQKKMKIVDFEKKTKTHLHHAKEEVQQESVQLSAENGGFPIAQKILLAWIGERIDKLDSFSLESALNLDHLESDEADEVNYSFKVEDEFMGENGAMIVIEGISRNETNSLIREIMTKLETILVIGSMSERTQPGYNSDGPGRIFFYNLTTEIADFIRSKVSQN